MKRFILLAFSVLLTFSFAIAQDGINYQGAATDANGDELTNQSISIRASVLSASASGNLEWEETHSATTDQFGLFNVVIGQGTNTTNGATATFDDMDWGSGNHFLKIELDATGGTNYAMIGTTQMMSVPYALYAKSANINYDSISNLLSNDSTFITNVGGGMGGGGCDFLYPDGFDGEAITMELIGSASYTVPNGKRLYVLSYSSGGGPNINGIFADFGDGKPIILNAGDILANDNGLDGAMNGFLVNANTGIDAITMELNASTSYTVPNGKRLYILRHSGGGENINGIQAANFIIANKPIILNAGDMFGNDNSTAPSQMHGYLADENYFAGCGGGGSSGTFVNGTTTGEMLFWDGTNWLALTPPNNNNMFLTYNTNSNAPEWVTSTANIVVTPVASFSVSADTIYQGGSINFTDNSTQYPIAWDWDFGDGNTSTQQHPTNTFYSAGTYVVTLIVSNNSWGDSTTHTIVVLDYPNAQVGHYRDGGVVFWVDPNDNTHGLVCDVSDVPGSGDWGCQGTIMGASGGGIGDGSQNTINILNGCSGNIAAKQCADNTAQGYTDWFLPSISELNAMYVNMSVIDSVAQVVGGSVFSNLYWTSTEYSSTHAKAQYFSGGTQTQHQKYSPHSVRAIRDF